MTRCQGVSVGSTARTSVACRRERRISDTSLGSILESCSSSAAMPCTRLRARALPECLSAVTVTTSCSPAVRNISAAMLVVEDLPRPNSASKPIMHGGFADSIALLNTLATDR